jgi:hypothetical protein
VKLVGFIGGGFDTAAPPERFLRALLVAPKIRLGRLFFYLLKLCAFGFRVKETSATRLRATTGLRIFASVLQSLQSVACCLLPLVC